MARRGYANRSEAVRDLLRAELERSLQQTPQGLHGVACLSYVYNHHERDLGERLTGMHHAHHDLTLSTTHVHLDHDHCLEAVLLRARRWACASSPMHCAPSVVCTTATSTSSASNPHQHHHHGDATAAHVHLKPSN